MNDFYDDCYDMDDIEDSDDMTPQEPEPQFPVEFQSFQRSEWVPEDVGRPDKDFAQVVLDHG